MVRERIQMVIASYEGTLRDASGKFACTHGKVWYWRRRYDGEGNAGLRTRPRDGRPSKIGAVKAARIRETVEKEDVPGGWQTKTVRQLIYDKAGVRYSDRHVVRLLHKWGFSRLKPRKRHALADEDEKRTFLKKPAES